MRGRSSISLPVQPPSPKEKETPSKADFSVDSGVSSNSSGSGLDQALAELKESNRHFKDLKIRMDGIDKRLKSLEECNAADDEEEASGKRP